VRKAKNGLKELAKPNEVPTDNILFICDLKYLSLVKKDMDVGEYVRKQKSPMREIVQRLRSIILKTFPTISEEVKMENGCALV